ISSWTFHPPAVDRGLLSGRDFPKRLKSAEMIHPHYIEHLECRAHSFHPPTISVVREHVPAVERIPPQLSRRAEIIGRNARHGVPPEQFGMRPDVGAVLSHV